MNKLILKSALISIAAVALAALAVFGMWLLCSPLTMAQACEKTGNYSFAVTCADMHYNRTKDINDLARCAEDGILSGKDNLIVKYCGMLSDEDGFDALCSQKNEALSGMDYVAYRMGYKVFILGNLSASRYRTGDFGGALKSAERGGEFAFTPLAIEIAEKGDKESAESVIGVLEGMTQTAQTAKLIKLLNETLNK